MDLSKQLRPFLSNAKRLAMFEACGIGIVSGLAAVLLKQGAELSAWRLSPEGPLPAWIALPLVGLLGGWLAGWLVEQFAPESVGSGISQVKAALANFPMALNLRVAIVKLISVILVIGSGLNLGRQGPTVQVGAALAAQLSRWIPTSPEYRRQLLAAGAAAGLAAGFNAPIAGVLFVVEELIQDFSGLTLGTAILASFIGAVVSRLLGGTGLNLDSNLNISQATFSLPDVPFFLILGLLAGLFGALFSKGIFFSLALNRRFLKVGLPYRIALAGLISGLMILILPVPFRDSSGLQEFISTGGASWNVIILAFVVKFLLTLIAYGAGAPGGIFAPALVLGSALGYLVGTGAETFVSLVGSPFGLAGSLSPTTTYALAGMGAFFSAITRGPVTAIVIVFEITMDFNLVLPLMIGSVIAYLVADRVSSGSFYNQLLALNGIHLEHYNTNIQGRWADLTADQVMQRRVETLSSQIPLREAMEAFSRSHHRGFPVVDQEKLVGIVTQGDLSAPSHLPIESVLLKDVMTTNPVTVGTDAPLTYVLYLLNRFKISRVPVVENHRLVGIITRADIIRAESDQLVGESPEIGPQPEPSYLIYQTRSPATGNGRLLVPISNPLTAPILINLALAIAKDRHYELECLRVIPVSRGQSPSESAVRSTESRRLLRKAERLAHARNIPIHTQIRVAHDSAQAILETLKERHIDLVLMGWKGNTNTPGRVFGGVVDTIIRQASCEVVVIKLHDRSPTFNHWLLPVAGGPNSQEAMELLPSMLTLGENPDVRVCQIFDVQQNPRDRSTLHDAVERLSHQLPYPVFARPIWGGSVADAILKVSWHDKCDVILVGATRETLLKQVMNGNIPEAIARGSQATVILVRQSI